MRILDIPGIVAISMPSEDTKVPINGIMIKQMMPAYRKDPDWFVDDMKKGNRHIPHFLISDTGTIYQLLELGKKSKISLDDDLKEDTERYIHIYLGGRRTGSISAEQELSLITLLVKLSTVNGLKKSTIYEYYSCFLYNTKALEDGKADKSNITTTGTYKTEVDKSKIILHDQPQEIKLKKLAPNDDINSVILICKLGAVAETYNWAINRTFKYTDTQTNKTISIDVSDCYFITSGYRNPEHNAAVGGVRNSQHTLGEAIDAQSNNNMVPPYKLVAELQSHIKDYVVGQILLESPIFETEEEGKKNLDKFGDLSTVFHISIPSVKDNRAIENPIYLNQIIKEVESRVPSEFAISVVDKILPGQEDFITVEVSSDTEISVPSPAELKDIKTINDIKPMLRVREQKGKDKKGGLKFVSIDKDKVKEAVEKAYEDLEQFKQTVLAVEANNATMIANNAVEVDNFYNPDTPVQTTTVFNKRLAASIKNIIAYDFNSDDWTIISI